MQVQSQFVDFAARVVHHCAHVLSQEELSERRWIVGISLGMTPKLESYIEDTLRYALSHSTNEVLVLIGDYLSRHNEVAFKNKSLKEAEQSVLEEGQIYVDIFTKVISQKFADQTKRIFVVRWLDIMNEGYNSKVKLLTKYFEEDLEARALTEEHVTQFAKYRDANLKLVGEKLEASIRYVVEELPMHCEGIWYQSQLFNVLFHPVFVHKVNLAEKPVGKNLVTISTKVQEAPEYEEFRKTIGLKVPCYWMDLVFEIPRVADCTKIKRSTSLENILQFKDSIPSSKIDTEQFDEVLNHLSAVEDLQFVTKEPVRDSLFRMLSFPTQLGHLMRVDELANVITILYQGSLEKIPVIFQLFNISGSGVLNEEEFLMMIRILGDSLKLSDQEINILNGQLLEQVFREKKEISLKDFTQKVTKKTGIELRKLLKI